MLPAWVKKLGKTKSVILWTTEVSILSISLSFLIKFLMSGGKSGSVTVNAIIYSIILTPVIGYFFIKGRFHLDTVSSQLRPLSNTDELTGVHNRRYFFEYMKHGLFLARRYGQVFSILMIDVDDFK